MFGFLVGRVDEDSTVDPRAGDAEIEGGDEEPVASEGDDVGLYKVFSGLNPFSNVISDIYVSLVVELLIW